MKSLFKWIMDHPITMSLAGFALAIAMNVWLPVVVVASFLLLVSTLFMSVTMSRRAYLLSQDVKVRWMLFLFVFVSGWVMYGRIGIDDMSCSWGNRLSEVNRVIAAFFPSRGGFELEGGGEVSGQYSLTNTVSALITNSVSRLGESKRNNDAYCVKSHSEALLRTETDEISDESKFLYYAWHFCAVSFVSMLLYSVFFGLYSIGYMKRLWDFRIRREFNLDLAYTFWGDSEAARVLAKSVTENGHKAIFQIARDSFREDDITKNMVLNLFKYQKCAVVFVAGLPDENHDEFSEGERIHLDVADVYSDHHFILGENTRFNVRLAKAIVEARKANGFTDNVNLFIRVENSAEEDLLCEWLDRNFDASANVFVHVIRETELLAEKYIENFPLLGGRYPLIESNFETGLARVADGHENLKILMIGFGCRGQELMNVMIENSRFITGFEQISASDGVKQQECIIPFSADIVAKDDTCFLAYRNKSGITWETYDLNAPYGALDVNSAEFDEKVLSDISKLNSYGRIIVCTGDDDLNISVASRICRRMKAGATPVSKGKLFVQLKSEEVYNRLVYQKTEKEGDVENRTRAVISPFENVEFFGMWNEIFTAENIIRKEIYNERDMWLNWYYCYESYYEDERWKKGNMWQSAKDSIGKPYYKKNQKTGMKEEKVFPSPKEIWRTTGWFDKRSTLASCVGQRNLLALLGYEIVDEEDSREAVKSVFSENSAAVIMLMARNEHIRWMAFLHTHGVLPWDLNFPTLENVKALVSPDENGVKKVKANARKVINRHAALVPFDDLPSVDLKIKKFNEPSFLGGEECFTGKGLGDDETKSLQWNDIKFVRWIPELMRLCGKKIVKI